MNRRHLIKSLIATTIASSIPTSAFAMPPPASAATKKYPWRNWSGNQECFPSLRAAPSNVAELQTLIRGSKGNIRAVGAGHSFSRLVPTDDTLVSIRRIAGLKRADKANRTASIYAGTILNEIGPMLAEQDQALINMPDIDQQTLSGAICTATHGTGQSLGSMSSYIKEIELVTATGDIETCSESTNPDLFRAAQVSLGALGIITSVTLQNTAPFKLKRESNWMSFEEGTAQAHQMAKDNRNFEFFYFPFTGMILTDKLNKTLEAVQEKGELDGNSGIMDLKTARDYLSWSSKLRELILGSYMKTIETTTIIDHSYSIYATERNVRFNEMEYHLPAETAMQALAEIRQAIESQFDEVFFPIECRFIHSEDAWMSPFHGRESVSIAVHRYFEEDYQPFFKVIEPILQKYEGRPHWGKLNTFSAKQISEAYPRFNDFKAIRQHYDPNGKFLNTYLKEIFELS